MCKKAKEQLNKKELNGIKSSATSQKIVIVIVIAIVIVIVIEIVIEIVTEIVMVPVWGCGFLVLEGVLKNNASISSLSLGSCYCIILCHIHIKLNGVKWHLY